jgi:mRNA-degrading endonuclease RelE of RelBE toxin-antitoxin system
VSESADTPRYAVLITATAESMLRDIKKVRGKQSYEQIKAAILDLEIEPRKKAQPLTGLLKHFHSLHLGRFRIVVQIKDSTVQVFVVGAGWHTSGDRDDIYQLLQRAVESGRIAKL